MMDIGKYTSVTGVEQKKHISEVMLDYIETVRSRYLDNIENIEEKRGSGGIKKKDGK